MNKHTTEELTEIVKNSLTMAQVARAVGVSTHGSARDNLKKKLIKLGIDFSHFKGQSWSGGKSNPRGDKRHWSVLLVDKPLQNRIRAYMLRNAMLECGFKYECAVCKTVDWQGKPLTLEVDHIDGRWSNNLPTNLRFLCPSCHSQTPNFKNKGR